MHDFNSSLASFCYREDEGEGNQRIDDDLDLCFSYPLSVERD